MKEKITTLLGQVKTYWKTPMKDRYMPFREIAAYAGGGIGVYFLITIGTACLLATSNTLISSTLGVDPTDMYVLYVIAVLANIPLTGIRASIIDNTRNKAGKYRPYIVSMGIPTAIVCVAMVWFPYNIFSTIFGDAQIFGRDASYVCKCALILLFNLVLHFCYYFFYDGYENLIHVLSPNTQERADVSSIKSIVYSLSPSITNLITPIIASNIFHTNTTDIRVYRLLYPILGILGIAFCIIVYGGTKEKIVQAKTHVVQIRFIDAIREVAKNKYFWIISLAGWIGFLESAYSNILYWLYNYGGACSGNVYGIIVTIYGNASLWGMLLAPFCIRKWGKKSVLVITNIFNIIFILMMWPATATLQNATIWLVLACLYLNGFMGAFMHILNPAIQADIRDYQQYRTGERIDGMFSAVATIGTVITLATSSVLPIIYKNGGINQETATAVTSNPDILSRMLGDGKTVGEILSEQFANGQDSYTNAYSALYNPDILLKLLHVLIIVSAIGALMNVIPFFWYDFNELKQKSVVRVLKVRAMFEDFNNGALKDKDLVDGIDIIRKAEELKNESPHKIDKKAYRSAKKACKDKESRKECKKQFKEQLEYNEEVEIAKFVNDELNKFSTPLYIHEVSVYSRVYEQGLEGLKNMTYEDIASEKAAAKAMPKGKKEERQMRRFSIELASKKKTARKSMDKLIKRNIPVEDPGVKLLEKYFDDEDKADAELTALYLQKKKEGNSSDIKAAIAEAKKAKEAAKKNSKAEMDRIADFNNAAKPYIDAKRLINQKENYTRLSEIEALYDEALARVNAEEENPAATVDIVE